LSENPSRANLAVRLTIKRLGITLSKIKRHPNFTNEFLVSNALIRSATVAWITIENSLEMYIFEPYCAMTQDTNEYNFFDTLQILAPNYANHN
jgi:hypothetical protein